MKTRPKTELYCDETAPFRRLACALLLGGALGAHAGVQSDIEWINSDVAKRLADLVGLPYWPPSASQLAGRRELRARANDCTSDSGYVGALSIRSIKRQQRRDTGGAAADQAQDRQPKADQFGPLATSAPAAAPAPARQSNGSHWRRWHEPRKKVSAELG